MDESYHFLDFLRLVRSTDVTALNAFVRRVDSQVTPSELLEARGVAGGDINRLAMYLLAKSRGCLQDEALALQQQVCDMQKCCQGWPMETIQRWFSPELVLAVKAAYEKATGEKFDQTDLRGQTDRFIQALPDAICRP
jgi:hypothetical protein